MSEPDKTTAIEEARKRVGTTLADRFRIDDVLGVGAMGVVYKAHHTGLRKDVALKLLRRDLTANEEMLARFEREAAAASRLDHPNCVRVMDFGSTADDQRFLVMEYLEGEDLADMVRSALPPFRAVGLVMQVLAGLEHAHQQGLVHRDIKPENIFVVAGGSGEQLKLLDFGIAKVQHGAGASQLTRAGMIFGTPHYMSPEQARGSKIDARGDLYSLGIVMYALLTGKLPFDGDDPVAVLRQHLSQPLPPLPSEIPASLRSFVERLLAKDPDERFPDATAAIGALKRAAAPTDPASNVSAPPVKELSSESAQTRSLASVRSGATLRVDGGAPAGERQGQPAAAAPGAPPRPRWVVPAVGIGLVAIVAVIALNRGDDEPSSADGEGVAAAASLVEPEGKPEAAPQEDPSADSEPAAAAEDDAPEDKVVIEDPPESGDVSQRALRANLASIDELIAAKKFEAARITIGPLLEVYPKEPGLHWRMGRVLYAISPRKNASAALDSYSEALQLDRASLHNEDFAGELWPLIDNPGLRVRASEVAVDLLGEAGHDRLVAWVNVQKAPLPYTQRHAATDHLDTVGKRDRINAPLQVALDLWQAREADDPCAAFGAALTQSAAAPDSYLAGTLDAVTVPTTSDGEPCAGHEEQLDALRADYAQRYAGLDPRLPTAFARRKTTSPTKTKKRRRRR